MIIITLHAGDVYLRSVHTGDSTHCTSEFKGNVTSICSLGPNDEILLDSYSVDAENECLNSWMFFAGIDSQVLSKYRELQPLITDRKQCIIDTIQTKYVNLHQRACTLHLKENLKTLGSGTEADLTNFDKMIHAPTSSLFDETKENFFKYCKTKTADYVTKSLLPMKLFWARYENVGINSACMEGVTTQQTSEAFHAALSKLQIKGQTPPYVISLIYQREVKKTLEYVSKYEKLIDKKQEFGPRLNLLFRNQCGSIDDYNIRKYSNVTLSTYEVTSKLNSNDTHIVNLDRKHCNQQCHNWNQLPCRHMFVAAKFDYVFSEKVIVPEKFCTDNGLKLFKASAANFAPYKTPHATSGILQEGHVSILPPHVRTQPGRPKKKRLTKGMRQREYAKKRRDRNYFFSCEIRCNLCGEIGHNSRTCTSGTNGRGLKMTRNEQNCALLKGFLALEVGLPGQTKLPKSLDEFDTMRDQQNEDFELIIEDLSTDDSDNSDESDDSNESDDTVLDDEQNDDRTDNAHFGYERESSSDDDEEQSDCSDDDEEQSDCSYEIFEQSRKENSINEQNGFEVPMICNDSETDSD